MSVLDNFQEWKDFLQRRVNQAENLGMDRDSINNVAYYLGDYLAKGVDPKNPQERVLQDLWSVADEGEQKVIASLMVKLVDGDGTQQNRVQ
jgi:signal transduction histidine kinase